MKEIFYYFLKLGATGFGGPLAVISQMQKDLVEDKKWISPGEFRALFGLIKAMPGPVAFQMASIMAYRRKGFWGALIAAFAFVFPAFCMIVIIANYYEQASEVPWIKSIFLGMQMAAFALIAWALKSLTKDFFKEIFFWICAISSTLLCTFTHIPEPLLILIFALTGLIAYKISLRKKSKSTLYGIDPILIQLFLVCFQAGAFIFGTGIAIIPWLEGEFVGRLHWLTHAQFLDAVSFGQLTPGPMSITTAFIGYRMVGLTGAIVGTMAIFLPPFVHMVTWFPRFYKWLLKQEWIHYFSMAVTAAVAGTIIVVLFRFAADYSRYELAGIFAMLLMLRFTRIPSWGLILLGGASSYLFTTFI